MGLPMVLALNMMDEAAALGIEIDLQELSRLIGVPVLLLVASKGRDVREVFLTALQVAQAQQVPPNLNLQEPVMAFPVASLSTPSFPSAMLVTCRWSCPREYWKTSGIVWLRRRLPS